MNNEGLSWIDGLLTMHYYQYLELIISPCDTELLVVFGNSDMPHEEYALEERNRSIWKLDSHGEAYQLTGHEEQDSHSPCYSPDGNTIAYLSKKSGKKEIWLMDKHGENKRQLTCSNFEGPDPFNGSMLSWSPDHRYILYTALPNGSRYGQNIVQRRMGNREKIEVISEPSDEVILSQKRLKDLVSTLYRVDIETGQTEPIFTLKGTVNKLLGWFDDKVLLIKHGNVLKRVHIESKEVSEVYSGRADLVKLLNSGGLLFANLSSSNEVEITSFFDGKVIPKGRVSLPGNSRLHCWSHDGSKLYVSSQQGVSNILYSVDVDELSLYPITAQNHVVHSYYHPSGPVSFNNQIGVVFPYSAPKEPAELHIAEAGSIEKISNFHGIYLPLNLSDVRVIQYPSEGWEIESILVLPRDYQPGHKYPALIYLHGGPEFYVEASFTELLSARAQSAAHFLAANGYAVLLPNFRGSEGYGDEHKNQLGSYQMMRNPYHDVMAAVNYLIQENIADPDKLGIYGTSFGANLTAWTISHTNCFKGAVSVIGVYDNLHHDRSNGQAFHAHPRYKNRLGNADPNAMWTTPDVYKELDSIEHISSIKTPLLLMETSAERKYGQNAKLLFNGLRFYDVESYLVFYPQAFHSGGWNDEYKKDYMLRLVAWFDYCLKGISLPEWFKNN
ncbi:S9 family peptidase [Paenibacillus sp. OAS669]|uniref:S9 family peptidase n=1 Tax=Paenibacillus sp. OAS669 TaxID=2663821 RepID=UPI00178C1575|nr:prolyl oligopeptidase family serine peptidase [Paenibacillus sp. OAS669]MBE1442711.1 dipeptidyl aminopeptidase/acylaminoacyl peptidase [Paenibacillus sp. OAS669]